MSGILSPSPYGWMDVLKPSKRQEMIYKEMHRANYNEERGEFTGSVIDLARRARAYQAELARMNAVCDSYADENQRFFDEREEFRKRGLAFRAMCEELCEALEPFSDKFLADDKTMCAWSAGHKELGKAKDTLTRARKLMEG